MILLLLIQYSFTGYCRQCKNRTKQNRIETITIKPVCCKFNCNSAIMLQLLQYWEGSEYLGVNRQECIYT